MRSLIPLLFALPFVAVVAQARETGDIRGSVVDTEGIDVPGAEIRLSGVDLAGELRTTTDASGSFRFDSLLPGTYTLQVVFDGETKVTAEVTVRLETSTNVPLTIDLTDGVTTVDVIYIQPVIDTTDSSFSRVVSEESMQNLPVGRSFQSVVATLPGVDGRVNTQDGGPSDGNPSVRGEGQYGNNYTLDGVSTRDPATNTFGQNVNFDAIDEIQVYTDGAPAEFGQATGMIVNVVTKDGGDEHHGSAALIYGQHAWFNKNYLILDSEQGIEVPTEKRRFRDPSLSLTAGGPLIKEKLWYFGAVDFGYSWYQSEGVAKEAAQKTWNGQVLAKLTWFPTADLTLRYLYTHGFNMQANESASQLVAPEAQTDRRDWTMTHLITATWKPDARSELTARVGYNQSQINVVPSSGDHLAPSITNESGLLAGNAMNFDINTRQRIGGGLTFQRFFGEAAGTHTFKAGAEYWYLRQVRDLQHTGETTIDWIGQDGVKTGVETPVGTEYSANPDLGYPCNEPDGSDCGYRQNWQNAGPLGTTSHTFTAYVQDDWAPHRNLTFNLGARLDIEAGRNDSGKPPTTQDVDQFTLDPADRDLGELKALIMPQPRVGMVWDATGDNKTKFSAFYGWFYDVAGADFWEWANERSSNGYVRSARDADGNWGWIQTQDAEGAPLIYAKNVKPAKQDKVTLGFERQIIPLLSIGLRGILSRTQGIAEDVDVNLDDWYVMNSPMKYRIYRGIELTLEKKFADNWQMLASYTLSESFGHLPGQFELASGAESGSNGNNVGVYLDDVGEQQVREDYYNNGLGWILEGFKGNGRYSVSDPAFNDDAGHLGYLPYHSFHKVKINGSYTMPWGTTLGVVYEFDSGHAWQKRTLIPFYGYDGMAQGRGTRFMPASHYLDFRIAHEQPLPKDQSLEVSLDLFNLPGLAQSITYFENDTTGFGSTLYRQAPRSVRLMVKYRW